MSFNYEKIKEKSDSSPWASYSDLFMVLSVVFLLLYVVTALRNGTSSLQSHIEVARLTSLNEDYKKQLSTYNNLKEGYLEKDATESETETYKNLMEKLSLLKDEAKDEKETLLRKSIQNAEKEQALNEYQQIVRNIINSNTLAKKRIKRRDKKIFENTKTIKERDVTIFENKKIISEQNREIEKKKKIIYAKNKIIKKKKKILSLKRKEIRLLEKDIKKKKKVIYSNTRKISKINKNLKRKLSQLSKERKQRKLSKKKYLAQIKEVKSKSAKSIRWIKSKSRKAKKLMTKYKGVMASANSQLSEANKTILKQQNEKKVLSKQISSVKSKLMLNNLNHKRQIMALDNNFQIQLSKAQDDFSESLNKQKLTANEKILKIKVFQKKQLAKRNKLQRKIASLSADKTNLKNDLEKTIFKASLKKRIAAKIKKNFRKNGIEAVVDTKTGDVFLTFGNTFFDKGKAHLKVNMVNKLEEFIPIYTKSLFDDKMIAKNIKSIDIVGFSSPTYRGKVISPTSLDPRDRKAIKFNLDLSYKRARSIFEHIFDTERFNFKHQKKMIPLVKVSGRSFFTGNGTRNKIVGGMSRKVFCKKYNCQKERKVIIKFDLHD